MQGTTFNGILECLVLNVSSGEIQFKRCTTREWHFRGEKYFFKRKTTAIAVVSKKLKRARRESNPHFKNRNLTCYPLHHERIYATYILYANL